MSGNVLFLLVMQASQIHSMIRIYTLLIHTPCFILLEYVHLLSGTCCPCWLSIDQSYSFSDTDVHPASYFCSTHTCSPHLSTCICQVRLFLLVTWTGQIGFMRQIPCFILLEYVHLSGTCVPVGYGDQPNSFNETGIPCFSPLEYVHLLSLIHISEPTRR